MNEYQKRYRATDKGRLSHKKANFKSHIKKKFGLSVQDYQDMLRLQDSACAICRLPAPENKRLHVDHDHGTGKVRSLLCMACNTGLGLFGDDNERLEAAARYLRRWNGT